MLARIAIVALTLQALALTVPQVGTSAEPTVIRIGVSDTDAAAQPLYAQQTGIFRRAGLDAKIVGGMQGGPVLDGIAAGAIDVGFANIVSIASAIQRGSPVVLLAAGSVYDSRAPLTVLVQSPSSNLRTGKDLNGKTVETPSARMDLATISTMAWIDQHGGDSGTVHFVAGIPLAEVADALKAGRVDVSELTEPHLSVQKRRGAVKVFASTYDAIASTFLIGGYVASKPWVEAHPEAAQHFAAAMRESAHWANTHQAETAPILAAQLKVDPSMVLTMVRSRYGETLSAQLIQPALDVAAKYGALKPMKAQELIASR